MSWTQSTSRGHHPLLLIDAVFISFRNLFGKYYDLPTLNTLQRHSGSLFIDDKQLQAVYGSITKKIYTDWSQKIVKKQINDLDSIVGLAKALSQQKIITKTELKNFYQQAAPLLVSAHFPIFISDVLEREFEQILPRYSKSTQDKIQKLIKTPAKELVHQKYLNFIKKNNFEAAKNKFPWIKSYFMEIRPLEKKMFDDDKKIARQVQKQVDIKIKGLDAKTKKLISVARLFVWFRDYRLYKITECFFYMHFALEKYSQKFNLSYDEIKQLTIDELLSGKIHKFKIKERLKEFGIVMEKGDISVCTGSKLEKLKRSREILTDKVVKGSVAFQGKVQGVVRIATPYNFNKVQAGDILVTSETTPESVQFIRKVKAIVTDEGGITCHAAIISREMKVPCIIGTKIATRVLKDGDLVEVDAYSGVVKILKTK